MMRVPMGPLKSNQPRFILSHTRHRNTAALPTREQGVLSGLRDVRCADMRTKAMLNARRRPLIAGSIGRVTSEARTVMRIRVLTSAPQPRFDGRVAYEIAGHGC